MVDHPMVTPCTKDGEPSVAPKRSLTERFSPVSLLPNPLYDEMSLPELAAQCLRELGNYRRGEPCMDIHGFELLRRATIQDNPEACAWVQHCFGGLVRGWLRHHPQREVACLLQSEENYVAQAFERFWQSTTSNPQVEFSTLAAALQYLRASLHGAILDMLRADARPRESLRPAPAEPGEPHRKDATSSSEVWDILKTLLSNPREVRLAYLLFHCGLGPKEIVHVCPQEFDDLREVSCLRRTIMERVLRNADLLRGQREANSVQKEQGRRR
jgi:hypothetical protein